MKKAKWVATVLAVCMLAAGGLTVRVQAAVPQGGEGWRAWYEAVPDAVRLESLVDSLVTSASAIETREDPAGLLKDVNLLILFPREVLSEDHPENQYSAERLRYEQGKDVWKNPVPDQNSEYDLLHLPNSWYQQMANELFGISDADLRARDLSVGFAPWVFEPAALNRDADGLYFPYSNYGDPPVADQMQFAVPKFAMTKCEMIPTGTDNLFAVKVYVDTIEYDIEWIRQHNDIPIWLSQTFHGTFQYTFAKVQPEGGTSFFRLCRIDRMG